MDASGVKDTAAEPGAVGQGEEKAAVASAPDTVIEEAAEKDGGSGPAPMDVDGAGARADEAAAPESSEKVDEPKAPEAVEAAPKRRGRPPKAAPPAKEAKTEETKKPRGRPPAQKKAPEPEPEVDDEVEEEQPQKRGRGRPKGSTKKVAAAPAKAAEKPKPRGRGKRTEAEAELSEEEVAKKAKTTAGEVKKPREAKQERPPVSIVGLHRSHGQTPGTVLTYGMGENDQLGYEAEERKKPKVVELLPAGGVLQVCCGGLHTAAVTAEGKVISFGVNDEGALGRLGAESEVSPMEGSINNKKAVQVSCGDSHTVVLCEDGSLWACGIYRDAQGKMGFDAAHGAGVVVTRPEQIGESSHADPVVRIVSGVDHTLALTKKGQLLSWGCGEQGRLGRLGRMLDRHKLQVQLAPSPVKISFPRKTPADGKRIVDVAAGAYHSFAIMADGSVWAWGASMSGQTGLEGARNVALPELVTTLAGKRIVAMAGGNHHSLALDDQGRVWSAGKGTGGVLGTGTEDHSLEGNEEDSPNKWCEVGGALAGQHMAAVACGSECSFALTREGALYAWGFGENLQLGTGKDEPEFSPVKVEGEQIKDRTLRLVSAGGQHVALLATP